MGESDSAGVGVRPLAGARGNSSLYISGARDPKGLKGRNISAQGNALGYGSERKIALKGP